MVAAVRLSGQRSHRLVHVTAVVDQPFVPAGKGGVVEHQKPHGRHVRGGRSDSCPAYAETPSGCTSATGGSGALPGGLRTSHATSTPPTIAIPATARNVTR